MNPKNKKKEETTQQPPPSPDEQQQNEQEEDENEQNESDKQGKKLTQQKTKRIIQSDENDAVSVNFVGSMSTFIDQGIAVLGDDIETFLNHGDFHFKDFEGLVRITPSVSRGFKLCDAIPRFFELVNLSIGTDYNKQEYSLFNASTDMPQVDATATMFSAGTSTIRVKLKKIVNGFTIEDPSSYGTGILTFASAIGANSDVTRFCHYIENRVYLMTSLFNATDMVLYTIPKRKVIPIIRHGGSTLLNEIINMSPVEDDFPSVYFTVFTSTPNWIKQWIESVHATNPVVLGCDCPEVVNGIKLSERVKVITDQFSTSIANKYYRDFLYHQRPPNVLQAQLEASVLDGDSVLMKQMSTINYTNIYNGTQSEWDLYLLINLISLKTQLEWREVILPMLEGTNRLLMNSVDQSAQTGKMITSIIGTTLSKYFRTSISVGSDSTPYKLLYIETMSSSYDLDLAQIAFPNDNCACLLLLDILIFFKMYPRISWKLTHSLGYYIHKCLQMMRPAEYQTWIRRYGVFSRGPNNSVSKSISSLTIEEARSGINYSFYYSHVSQGNDRFNAEMSSLATLLKPTLYEITLRKKMSAQYPYVDSEYKAFMSWPHHKSLQLACDELNPMVAPLNECFTWLLSFVRQSSSMQDSSISSGQVLSFLNSMHSEFTMLAATCASTLTYTCAQMQYSLMEAPGYVYDEFISQSWPAPPSRLCLVNEQPSLKGVIVKQTRVADINLFLGMATFYRMQGVSPRDYPARLNPITSRTLDQQDRSVLNFDPAILVETADKLMMLGRKFGIAFQICRWVLGQDETTCPFNRYSAQLKPYLNMSNSVLLAKEIFRRLEVQLDDIFWSDDISGYFNPKHLMIQVRRFNQVSLSPEVNCPVGTVFGTDIALVSNTIKEVFTTLSTMLISSDSPLQNLSIGAYVGRFFVNELGPIQTVREPDYDVYDLGRYNFVQIASKGGMTNALKLLDYENNEGDEHQDGEAVRPDVITYQPLLDEFNSKIMLCINNTATIPETHLEDLITAIARGFVHLKILVQPFIITIDDVTPESLSMSRYEDVMSTASYLHSILSQPGYQLSNITVRSTLHTSAVTIQSQAVPSSYIQWFIPMDSFDRSIHAANLYTMKTSTSALPSVREIEYGKELGVGVDMAYSDGTSKLSSGSVNFNNSYIAVSNVVKETNVKFSIVKDAVG